MGTSNYLGLDNGRRDITAPNDREHFSGRVAHLRFPVVLTLTKGIWDFDGWLETSVALAITWLRRGFAGMSCPWQLILFFRKRICLVDRVRLSVPSYLPHLLIAHYPNSARVFLMSSPSSPVLQQLRHLDRSLPNFHDQLCNVLYGEEYTRCAPNIQGDDLVCIVDYLDKVRPRVLLPRPPLSQRRLSTVSILPVLLSASVCVNSEVGAALGGYFQHRTCFRLTF